jgi:hypothetical protein
MKPANVNIGKTGSELRWGFLEGIDIGREGDPYLDRLRIIQSPLCSIYLHHIHRPDIEIDPHDHPWSFISIVITGDYTEEVWPDKRDSSLSYTSWRRRWSAHKMDRESAHIITETRKPLWTLVITGPKRTSWGFWRNGEFTPWRKYMNVRSL